MSNIISISIAKDFSETPGARYTGDGQFSGQTFYEKFLRDSFAKLKDDDVLQIDLDDIYYPPSSFLSESFGPLYRDYGRDKIWSKIKFISNDDPTLVDTIKLYAREYDL